MGALSVFTRRSSDNDTLTRLIEQVQMSIASKSIHDQKLTDMVLSTESYSPEQTATIGSVLNNIEAVLKSVASDLHISLEDYQAEAGVAAAVLGMNPQAVITKGLRHVSAPGAIEVRMGVEGASYTRPVSFEAYDERENRAAQVHSIVYNMLASKQDEFAEAFFPTIVVNPTEAGVLLNVKIYQVFNDFKRSVTGSLADKRPVNLVRAYVDPNIIKTDLTRAIPVLRATGGSDDNSNKFVSPTDVAPWTEQIGNQLIQTSAVKVGQKVDWLGLSQTNELLAAGILDSTDNLDTYIKLEKIFIKVIDPSNTSNVDVFVFDVSNVFGSTFNYAVQGNQRKMTLNLDTTSLVLTNDQKRVDGTAPVVLTELAANNWDVRLHLNISGEVVLDTAQTVINRGTIGVEIVRDAAGNIVTPTTQFLNKIATADVIGYTLIAYRANGNIRQRGQLLESQVFNEVVNIPYQSPLSALKPVTDDLSSQSSMLQLLIAGTAMMTNASAVRALFKAANELKAYKAIADMAGELPETAGIARYLLRPAYFEATLDLSQTVDSLRSQDRYSDIRAAIVEKIRYYATEMYRTSQYKAAALVTTNNINFKPTVIVGTDPVIYNYIMKDGDLRTLGELFDVKIVQTVNKDVTGKIFITFGVFDANRNVSVNPLNFGNMFWSPELTVSMPVSRNGQVSHELIVTPRFLHKVNMPVLTVLTVTGLPSVTSKVALNMHTV
jgi:hypothetical protein